MAVRCSEAPGGGVRTASLRLGMSPRLTRSHQHDPSRQPCCCSSSSLRDSDAVFSAPPALLLVGSRCWSAPSDSSASFPPVRASRSEWSLPLLPGRSSAAHLVIGTKQLEEAQGCRCLSLGPHPESPSRSSFDALVGKQTLTAAPVAPPPSQGPPSAGGLNSCGC